MKKVRHHIFEIKQALFNAGIDPEIIKEFLETQIDVVRNINHFIHVDRPFRSEYVLNEIKMTEIRILKDVLDSNDRSEYTFPEVPIDSIQLGEQLKEALIHAELDPEIIYEFLELQIEVFRVVLTSTEGELSKEERSRNELKMKQVILLKNLLR